jgi:predicted Rossmann fold nucleotide-binding protein DprA/Smf involved in DNA uptake
MNPVLSLNTQAILLLTAPLIAGRNATTPDLLTPGEYKRLARHLHNLQQQPADLLSSETTDLLRSCETMIDQDRLQRLLGRGFLLSQAIQHWQSRSIWVVSRADADYPQYLKRRLKEDAPVLIYGCGDQNLIKTDGFAVVGSRNVDNSLIDYAMDAGRLSAKANKTLVSGGARGVDQAAMRGALDAGGKAIGVLADSLEKTAMRHDHRHLLMNAQLTLISPYDPNAGFNVGHAMQRNKLIYALADAALVVNADFNKGGTWAGAIEQLDPLPRIPVYVRSTGDIGAGLLALEKKGALLWPNPQEPDTFITVFDVALPSKKATVAQSHLAVLDQQPTSLAASGNQLQTPFENTAAQLASSCLQPAMCPADVLFATVRDLLRNMQAPKTDAEIAADLNVSKNQIKEWLNRLVEEGLLEKQHKPLRYGVKAQHLLLK